MRKLALLLLLAGTVPPAFSAKHVTLDTVDQLLIHAHGKPDARVAKQLFGLELTERVSSARLALGGGIARPQVSASAGCVGRRFGISAASAR